MPLPRPHPRRRPGRLLAAGAVTAGAALFGTALGGVAAVDGRLAAATATTAPAPAPAAVVVRVDHVVRAPAARDCPEPSPHRDL